ncbi:lysophosphatidylserine lipase ABHD12-like [Macrosteles quadrilineatus]|uniref:lysophosphatidylserine lipase ABHD12-like n=1 Tax=Macrosteles quadrilineatus TaxID=74068 RepID=UPI0023E0D527|nr:lysophosphatidylserine lipase ABHD12-like [Macrosteles quadrilineatus]
MIDVTWLVKRRAKTMGLFRNKTLKRTLCGFLGLAGLTVVLVYVVVPILFLWFPGIMRSFIFEAKGKIKDEELPLFMDYEHPEKVGFVGAKNFYVNSTDGAKVGVWHTLPVGQAMNETNTDETYRQSMANATVVLYLHGSAGTRASSHRLRVYRLLNKINYHVFALDYRGYGDSKGFAKNETDLIEDAKAVYTWIRERVISGHILLWGHSLGTGVAAHLADLLVSRGDPLSGVIMESPFDNMASAVRAHHLAKIVAPVPWFEHCFIQPLYDNDMAFSSDKHLSNITTPVLIFHAKDDKVIPYEQSVQLYEAVTSARKDSASIEFISYDASLGYGHYNIPLDPNFNSTVREFVDKSIHRVT